MSRRRKGTSQSAEVGSNIPSSPSLTRHLPSRNLPRPYRRPALSSPPFLGYTNKPSFDTTSLIDCPHSRHRCHGTLWPRLGGPSRVVRTAKWFKVCSLLHIKV